VSFASTPGAGWFRVVLIFVAKVSATATGGATTVSVAVLLVPPVPPSVELIAPVVLLLTPVVVAVTSTFTVQFEFAARVPPVKVSVVSPALGVKVPPQAVVALGVAATCNPDGRVSLNAIPVKAVVRFGLVMVKVRVDTPPVQIVVGLNALDIVGAPTTVIMAVLLVAPGPLSVALMTPVVFICTPAAVPVTVTLNEQLALAASVPPVNEIMLGAVVVTVPPQVVADPVGTDSPAGSVSVKLIPVSASPEFGLVIVKVRLVVPPTRMLAAPKPLVMVGGEATVTVAVLLTAPVPPLVDVTAPVVLFLTPAVVPVTVTLKVHMPPPAIVAPLSVIKLLPVTVKVPPHWLEPALFGVVSPAGRVSVKPTPVNDVDEFGLVIVKLRLVVPPTEMFAAPNALLIVGGASTVTVAVLLVAPVPPSVDVMAPVVLLLSPAVVPVTGTLKVQVVGLAP